MEKVFGSGNIVRIVTSNGNMCRGIIITGDEHFFRFLCESGDIKIISIDTIQDIENAEVDDELFAFLNNLWCSILMRDNCMKEQERLAKEIVERNEEVEKELAKLKDRYAKIH